MHKISKYLNFLKDKGIPLSTINPGSHEVALSVHDAFEALELLEDSQTAILGGDILSEDENGKLGYALHIWGHDYHYLSWSCSQQEDEAWEEYIERSHNFAEDSIKKAHAIAEQLKKSCYIVLVLSQGMPHYLALLKSKGKPVHAMNSSNRPEVLDINSAFQALEFLQNSKHPILGGEIFSENESGELVPAMTVWNYDSGYLNWQCNKLIIENEDDYAKRSHLVAKEAIKKVNTVAKNLGKKCYIMFLV